jgi:hypothetical protein
MLLSAIGIGLGTDYMLVVHDIDVRLASFY